MSLAAAAAVAVVALVVAAEPATGKEEFQAAVKLFRAKKADAALPLFVKAYELSGRRPATILALAQCERALKMYEQAIGHYREYLEREPNAKDRQAVAETVKLLEAQVAKERRPPALAVSAPDTSARDASATKAIDAAAPAKPSDPSAGSRSARAPGASSKASEADASATRPSDSGASAKASDPGASATRPSAPGASATKPSDPGASATKPSDPGARPSAPGASATKPSAPGASAKASEADASATKPSDPGASATSAAEAISPRRPPPPTAAPVTPRANVAPTDATELTSDGPSAAKITLLASGAAAVIAGAIFTYRAISLERDVESDAARAMSSPAALQATADRGFESAIAADALIGTGSIALLIALLID